MTKTKIEVELVKVLVEIIGPLFAGREPEIVSATLADLTATWLAGYQGDDVNKLREDLFAQYIDLVRRLIPVNEKEMLERIRRNAH
jgi:hypothetical protein